MLSVKYGVERVTLKCITLLMDMMHLKRIKLKLLRTIIYYHVGTVTVEYARILNKMLISAECANIMQIYV